MTEPGAETALAVSFADVKAAARRIEGKAVRTPLLSSPALDQATGGKILIKPECLQLTGSFKFRGAYNRLSLLSAEERRRGVVAFSSGNHGQGVALAAKMLGIDAVIVMPGDAPGIKLDNTRAHGAKIVIFDRQTEDREQVAAAIADEQGRILVPSYDDALIIAGQGTSALEVMEEVSDAEITLDAYVVPAGGGGLMAGSALAIREFSARTLIYSAEPENFDDHARSLAAGERLANAPDAPDSLCDALMAPMPGALTFPINKRFVTGGLVVSEEEIRAAVRFALSELRLVVEPGGAVALAAVLAGKIETQDRVIGLVLSGGNMDVAQLCRIVAEG
ncbi:MAG: threonine/serine dehydratase [Proteobacteria bacterium]|nr:threonine/serine dehydratase [Pseudomonadota bacterium]